jgi:hypothetical protein
LCAFTSLSEKNDTPYPAGLSLSPSVPPQNA